MRNRLLVRSTDERFLAVKNLATIGFTSKQKSRKILE